MSTLEFVVRVIELPVPNPLAPKYTDTVFFSLEAAESFLTDAFCELDDVALFTREISV